MTEQPEGLQPLGQANSGPAGAGNREMRMPSRARQSIRPPLALWLAVAAVVVLFGIIWAAVTFAVDSGGDSCPSEVTGSGEHEERCR